MEPYFLSMKQIQQLRKYNIDSNKIQQNKITPKENYFSKPVIIDPFQRIRDYLYSS
jgi:hypothetical protein